MLGQMYIEVHASAMQTCESATEITAAKRDTDQRRTVRWTIHTLAMPSSSAPFSAPRSRHGNPQKKSIVCHGHGIVRFLGGGRRFGRLWGVAGFLEGVARDSAPQDLDLKTTGLPSKRKAILCLTPSGVRHLLRTSGRKARAKKSTIAQWTEENTKTQLRTAPFATITTGSTNRHRSCTALFRT